MSEERVDNIGLPVQTDHNIRSFIFFDRMDNPRSNIQIITAHHRDRHIGGSSNHSSLLQIPFALLLFLLRTVIVINHIQCHQCILLLGILYHQSQINQIFNRLRISDRNQDLFLIYLFSFFFRLHIFIQSETAGRTFGHQRTDDASEKYHHYRAVQYIIIQQAFSILHNDFMADQYCCQCSRSLRITQAKYHAPLIRLHPVYLLRDPGSQPFTKGRHHRHYNSHLQCFTSGKQAPYINNHPDTNQEVRNKQRISHKLQAVHQRRYMRNQTIQHQACQKST